MLPIPPSSSAAVSRSSRASMAEPSSLPMSKAQRALWTFLMYALAGPFFAALGVLFVVLFAVVFNLVPLLPGATPPPMGAAALQTFVFAVPPSVATGVALAIVVFRYATFSWVLAAAVGIIAFSVFSFALPDDLTDARPFMAFLAGIVAIVGRQVLLAIGIIGD